MKKRVIILNEEQAEFLTEMIEATIEDVHEASDEAMSPQGFGDMPEYSTALSLLTQIRNQIEIAKDSWA